MKTFVKRHRFTCDDCGRGFEYQEGKKSYVSEYGMGYYSGACYYGADKSTFGITVYTTDRECPFCHSEDITEYIRGEEREIFMTYKIVRIRKAKA